MKITLSSLLAAFVFILAGCTSGSTVKIKDLRVEMKENPVGVGVSQPRFMWKISSESPDLVQTSYQIQVADSPDKLKNGDDLLWDTGEIKSDASIQIPYEGSPLQSRKQYYWRVKSNTNQGTTNWSEVNTWSMALLNPSEWKATWIGENNLSNQGETYQGKSRLAARYLRKEFTADKTVQRAVLYISGLGSSESYINGKRVSEDIFAPGPSWYPNRVYYNVYDVTGLLSKDKNTIGIALGNGRYFGMRDMQKATLPSLLAQLEIEYTDGSQTTILSDTSWKVTSKGPIIANNEFDGEEYDARLELEGWNKNGFDDSKWMAADVMETPPGELTVQANPNLRIQEEIKPVNITERPDGKYIIDMGQNMVGWLAIDLKGKKEPITMTFAEILKEDGSLYLDNLRTANVTDIYTPAKDGNFSWKPSFVYHGFRFVEITGLDYKPELAAFTGAVIYDEMNTTGKFETSNPLVNQIYKNAYWGIRGNYRGMPTDCPQRDERLGWLGDRVTGAYGEAFIFDNALLYNKWLQDIEDSQSPEGSISDVSPRYWTLYNDDVTWPAAYFYVANLLYRQFGDKSGIIRHYLSMKRWMEHMQQTAMKDYIIVKDTYGDWCMPPESQELIHSQDPARKTDGAILATTMYYSLLNMMSEFARLSGHENDIAAYQELAAKMKEAYNAKYFNPETAQYGNNTVTANMLSLRLGLVPNGYEEKVFTNIVKKTEEDFGGHVSTGVLGIQHLMRGLTEYGRVDMAWKIATNETYPSWGYMVKKGATTIWELWNGDTADPAMNSANHVMLLGDLIIWYYEDLAGIKCAPDAIAYKKLVMAPVFPEGLNSVSASYESVYGEIKSAWKKENGSFNWDITIPGNTSAIVRIPKEFGIKHANQPGVRKVSDTATYTEIEIGSGSYHF